MHKELKMGEPVSNNEYPTGCCLKCDQLMHKCLASFPTVCSEKSCKVAGNSCVTLSIRKTTQEYKFELVQKRFNFASI